MYLKELDNILGSPLQGTKPGTPEISRVVADSREITAGTVFVAVQGTVIDGHDFIRQAMEKGCLAVVAEHFLKNSRIS